MSVMARHATYVLRMSGKVHDICILCSAREVLLCRFERDAKLLKSEREWRDTMLESALTCERKVIREKKMFRSSRDVLSTFPNDLVEKMWF